MFSCLENRAFQAENGFGQEARGLAARLATHRLGAREVAALHRAALVDLVDGESAERAHAVLDAGAESLIAVLGHLADGYLAAQRLAPRRTAEPSPSLAARRPAPAEVVAAAPDAAVVLHLVVAGHSSRTRNLERALEQIVARRRSGETRVVVSNLKEEPGLYQELQVLATPVIIREQPGPSRRLVGSSTDVELIISELELDVPAATASTPARAVTRLHPEAEPEPEAAAPAAEAG